jgi:ATP/maltotriose-dependent transcriptional regulator MalT
VARGLLPLTAREVEVLTLAALGLPVSAIGERLAISRGTVKSHLENIYAKLGVVNRTAAVAHALRSGLIE